MAVERYDRKEATDPRLRQVDYSAPQIADDGGVIRNLGRSLLGTAEPILERKRTMEAEIDVGNAPLMKDPQGNVMRAEPIPGGGTVYADAFRQAASTLYKSRLLADYEEQMTNIIRQYPEEPMTAMANIKAHTEAVIETIPPDIRATIEGDLLRESTQKFNWLTNTKISRDRNAMMQGLEGDYSGKEALYLQRRSAAAAVGDDALVDQLDREFESFATENRKARVDLGMTSDKGIEGEVAGVSSRTFDMNLEMTSLKSKQYVVGRSRELIDDPTQLQLMVKWATGDPTLGEGKVLGMDYGQWTTFLGSPRAVQEMAAYGAEVIGDIDRAAAATAATEVTNANALKDQQINDRIAGLGEMAFQDKDFRDQWNAKINRDLAEKGMTITTYMNTYEGMADMQNQVAQSGQLPTLLKTWIEDQATGTNLHKVTEFVHNMLGVRSPKTGMGTGIMAWKLIDGKTRGYLTRYRELADAGVPTELRRDMVEQMVSGKYERNNLALAFDPVDGKNGKKLYLAERDKVIQAMFGVPNSGLPPSMRDMIDRDAQAFLHAYGQDPAQAVRAAIEGVATVWTPSSFGVQGYIPTELAGLGLTPSQLDKAFGNWVYGKGHVFGGAGFTTTTNKGLPRARIELEDDTQLFRGAGNYKVYHYDINGKLIYPIRRVNIDDVLVAHFGSAAVLEDRMNKARVAAAKQRRKLVWDAEQMGKTIAGAGVP